MNQHDAKAATKDFAKRRKIEQVEERKTHYKIQPYTVKLKKPLIETKTLLGGPDCNVGGRMQCQHNWNVLIHVSILQFQCLQQLASIARTSVWPTRLPCGQFAFLVVPLPSLWSNRLICCQLAFFVVKLPYLWSSRPLCGQIALSVVTSPSLWSIRLPCGQLAFVVVNSPYLWSHGLPCSHFAFFTVQ